MRQEIDLKIGASFTRFQTLNFGKYSSPKHPLLSYGPCQFPTLGFVVERWKEVENFVPEAYWSLKLIKQLPVGNKKQTVRFHWVRERMEDKER